MKLSELFTREICKNGFDLDPDTVFDGLPQWEYFKEEARDATNALEKVLAVAVEDPLFDHDYNTIKYFCANLILKLREK